VKALIASGGRGTRLRPITHTRNKHLIPIANKPILHYAIEAAADAGIREIGIVVNADSDEVPRAIGDGTRWGVKITFIPQATPGGLAQVVALAQPFVGNDRFIFYLGDNMVVGGVRRFVEEFERSGCNCFLTLAKVKDPERFGVPEIREGRIVGVEEKPDLKLEILAGIYMFKPPMLDLIPKGRYYGMDTLIKDMIARHLKIAKYPIREYWLDIGRVNDYEVAQEAYREHFAGLKKPVTP